jgi:hypothetical protein
VCERKSVHVAQLDDGLYMVVCVCGWVGGGGVVVYVLMGVWVYLCGGGGLGSLGRWGGRERVYMCTMYTRI